MINVLIWGNVARMFFVEIVSLERMGERFQLKKLMASIPFVFETVSFVDSSPLRRRKFLLGRRERLLRNCVTFLSVPSYRTAPRLKHRCTEKKKKGEKSILRIWWTFQERSNGRATLHEGRDDLQLVNLCVPPRSTIVVSKINSRDSSISLSTSTKNRTVIFYIRGRKKKEERIKTMTIDCTRFKNHSFESFSLLRFTFFSIIFASSSVCTWTHEERGGGGCDSSRFEKTGKTNRKIILTGLRTQKKTRRNNGTALIRFGEENRWRLGTREPRQWY